MSDNFKIITRRGAEKISFNFIESLLCNNVCYYCSLNNCNKKNHSNINKKYQKFVNNKLYKLIKNPKIILGKNKTFLKSINNNISKLNFKKYYLKVCISEFNENKCDNCLKNNYFIVEYNCNKYLYML